MIKKLDLPLILLAIAGFLAPLIGGHIALDATGLAKGSDPIVSALLGAIETPTLSHGILALLCAVSLIVTLLQRKVMQVPNSTVGSLILVLLALIVSSIGISSFRGVSIPAAMEWVTYGISFYAVVAAVGRDRGPTILFGSVFAGCVVLSYLGIADYGDMKATDPTWRIFTQWAGPNAMAIMLAVGFLLGQGLGINAPRIGKILAGLGCVAIGLALFLTQSKGCILALAVGIVAYVVMLIFWLPRKELPSAAGFLGATVALVLVLSAAASHQPKTSGGTSHSAASRLMDTGASAEQSVGFRKLLWKSSVKLIQQNPMGSGIGTFQYESARPGLNTQTHMAHEAYLQLAVEASALAPALFITALLFWSRLVFRGGAKLRSSQNVLRASAFAAVLTVAGHSLVDSNFSYYAVGLVFFMILGIGLLLSSDAVAPEFLPAAFRRAAASGVIALSFLFLYLGWAEGVRAQIRGSIEAREAGEIGPRLESLRSMAPWDADAWYLSAQTAPDPAERLQFAKRTVDLGPSTRSLRFLARMEMMSGQTSDALGALQRAEQIDPYNMQTLTLLHDLEMAMGEPEKAKKTLQQIVDVENTEYFKVRSLPELVPTETYEARIKLAGLASTPQEKISLLAPAVIGFKQYLALTVPNVVRFAQNKDGALPFGGETANTVRMKMETANLAAKSLADAYRAVGDAGKAAEADEDAAVFAKPLDLPSAK